ncbi:MAG: hydroxymethylglutaryl-CoA lyase, partial [Chitinophagaceae bacterium]
IAASLEQVEAIQNLCVKRSKQLVVYISMGFGNPYGDDYNADVAIHWVEKLATLGIKTIAMSDTVGIAQAETIDYIFKQLIPAFPSLEIGAHFHASPSDWKMKLETSYGAGCRRFDSALKGIGGCPMAEDELVGNMATENLVSWCDSHNIPLSLDREAFESAMQIANRIFL